MVRGLPEAPRWAWVVMSVGAVSIGLLFPVALHRGAIDPGTLPAGAPGSATSEETPTASAPPTTSASPPPAPALVTRLRADGVLSTVFLGDGITAGAGASLPAQTAFPALMTARLRADGPVQAVTVARQGARTADALPAVATTAPADLVVIELGTNDLLGGNAQQFAAGYPALLDAVRARSPDAVLLCAGTWAPSATTAPYDAVVRTACAAQGGRYVALSPVYEQPDAHTPGDETHPDDVGHRAIADALLAQVRG